MLKRLFLFKKAKDKMHPGHGNKHDKDTRHPDKHQRYFHTVALSNPKRKNKTPTTNAKAHQEKTNSDLVFSFSKNKHGDQEHAGGKKEREKRGNIHK